MIELSRGSVLLRDWRDDDAEALAPLANDRRVWLNLRDAFPHPYGFEDAVRFIAASRAMAPPGNFAIVAGSRLAGGIGFKRGVDVERVGAEVGYWVAPAFWGRGIATTALLALTDHAFEAHPELTRLYALPYAVNIASARVLEKAGYRREGRLKRSALKDGRLLDQWIYAIVRDEWAGKADALSEMLTALAPTLHAGTYAFVSVPFDRDFAGLDPVATFREDEGLTLVLDEERARAAGLPILFRAAWITLSVHSELAAVGLTAAVSAALADAGIACNVLAAAHHDHLFVPVESAQAAIDVLRRLQGRRPA